MAVYKVPQDVEADDKLIGPFSFRQFIYLIVVAISIAGAWGLSQLFIPLAIIPLPFIIFFSALALPLRKDQPMEAYLSAVVSFYFLKSHKRLWQPDGIDSFVTIIPPKDSEKILTKEIDETEASKRLGFLAEVVDTHGWAVRGANSTMDTSLSKDIYYEAQAATDVMAEQSSKAQEMNRKLDVAAAKQKKEAGRTIKTAMRQTTQPAQRTAPVAPARQAQPAPAKPVQTAPRQNPDQPPVSKLPTLQEIKAREADTVRRRTDEDNREALTYANFLAEQAAEEKGVPTPQAPAASQETTLTNEQARALAEQQGVTLQTVSGQAQRVAAENKRMKEGDEVVISLHH